MAVTHSVSKRQKATKKAETETLKNAPSAPVCFRFVPSRILGRACLCKTKEKNKKIRSITDMLSLVEFRSHPSVAW